MTATAAMTMMDVDDSYNSLVIASAWTGQPSGSSKAADAFSRVDGPTGHAPWALGSLMSYGARSAYPAAGWVSLEEARPTKVVVLAKPASAHVPLPLYPLEPDNARLIFSAAAAEPSTPVSEQVDVEALAITAGERLAAIQRTLSLSVTEVAQVLGVARGTLYGWMKGTVPVPKMQSDSNRLSELHRVATMWRTRTNETLGRLVAAPVGDEGTSLLSLLSAPEWQFTAIESTMEALAARLEAQFSERRAQRGACIGVARPITAENIEFERLRLRGIG